MDLWAEWCGPCKQLSPVLEKLAAEAGGQWILAKVDVDANPQLSAALQVQSIPMVVAVLGGQLVDGFLGAMPEAQVRQWIGQVLAVAEKMGMQLAAPAAADADDLEGDADIAADADAAPGARRIPAGLRRGPRGHGARRPGRRREGVRAGAGGQSRRPGGQDRAGPGQPDPPGQPYDQAKARRDAAERPGDVAAQARVADIDIANGRIEEAFNRLLGVVRRTSGEERDQARVHLVGLFELLPPNDPQVKKARSALSALLF